MSLVDETKTALDETRMLMLGAQILLGFQFQAPFHNAFSKLSFGERIVELVVLSLIVVVVGVLVTPSARHRIVDDGEASQQINRFITRTAMATLPVFAIAMGLDLGIAGTRIGGVGTGIVSAILGTVFPVALWFGPLALRGAREDETMPTSDKKTPLEARIDYVLTEARVVLPGAQALLGFQLAIVLTESFAELPVAAKAMHGAALALIAIATALLIAPAAYHRIIYAGRDEPGFHRLASRLVLLATIFLAAGLAGDTYVVAVKITDNDRLAVVMAVATAALLIGLWHGWPWWLRVTRTRAHRDREDIGPERRP